MGRTSLRGARLGANSLENESGIESRRVSASPTTARRGTCSRSRSRSRPTFPRPGSARVRRRGAAGDGAAARAQGSRSRRARTGTCCWSGARIAELEEILDERLELLRAGDGPRTCTAAEARPRAPDAHRRRQRPPAPAEAGRPSGSSDVACALGSTGRQPSARRQLGPGHRPRGGPIPAAAWPATRRRSGGGDRLGQDPAGDRPGERQHEEQPEQVGEEARRQQQRAADQDQRAVGELACRGIWPAAQRRRAGPARRAGPRA